MNARVVAALPIIPIVISILVLMLLKEFIYWSGHFPLSVLFERLPFYCLVPCKYAFIYIKMYISALH